MISLGNPWGLLALLVIPLLLLLHGLRSRRTTVVVSTTMLWESVLNAHPPEAGVRGRRPNLRLIFLLLFVALVALALSQPRWAVPGLVGGDAVVILDASASMKATNSLKPDSEYRFALAQAEAHRLIDRLPSGARMLVITSARTALVRSGFLGDKYELHAVVKALAPTDEAGRPGVALALARTLLVDRSKHRIYWITDKAGAGHLKGGPSELDRVVVGETVPKAAANVAITAFEVRPDVSGLGQFQALVRVANFGPDALTVPVEISGDDQVLISAPVELTPGASETLLVDFESRGVTVVRAAIAHRDALASDNVAYAVLSSPVGLRVRLVTPGSEFLEQVLRSLAGVVLTVTADNDKLSQGGSPPDFDLVVYDGIGLETLPPGRSVLINTIPADWGERIGPSVDRPMIVGSAKGPVMRNVALRAVRIERALGLLRRPETQLGEASAAGSTTLLGLQSLFWSDDTILSFAFAAPNQRAIYLGFDLAASNFPLLPSFPIFVDQAVRWLVDERQAGQPTSVQTGTPVIVSRTGESGPSSELVVSTPDGRNIRETTGGVSTRFAETSTVGVYRFRSGESTGAFAVNLLDRDESNLVAEPGSGSDRARADPPKASAERANLKAEQLLWSLFAAAALLVLVLEWVMMAPRERA